jgi:hypothetical protein
MLYRCLAEGLFEKFGIKKYQLIGVTCLSIAAKFEEIYYPDADDYCYVSDNACSVEDIASMEAQVMEQLNYNIVTPCVCDFFQLFYSGANVVDCHKFEMIYEYCTLNAEFMQFKCSEQASSILLFLEMPSHCDPDAVRDTKCYKWLCDFIEREYQYPKLKAIYNKYSGKKKHCVAKEFWGTLGPEGSSL